MSTTNCALIGAGRMGEVHARIINEHPTANLAAVVDPNEAVGKTVATAHDAAWYSTTSAAIAAGITTYVVAVPDRLHVDIAVELLDANCDVLLEKPLADTYAGAQRIVAAANASQGRLLVGHVLRHDPRFQIAAEKVSTGELGDPIHARASRIVPRSVGYANNGHSPIYMYQGIHDIDLLQWVVGHDIVEVCAATSSKVLAAADVPGVDAALVLCRFTNDAIATLEISWALPDSNPTGLYADFDIYGTAGALNIAVADQGMHQHHLDGTFTLPDTTLGPEIGGRLTGIVVDQFHSFVSAIHHQQDFPIEPAEAAQAVAVLDAITTSLDVNGWVPVDTGPSD